MNIEETKKAIEVMQAFVDGKVIQYLDRNKEWQDIDPKKGMGVSWNWFDKEYRIKREPHYRPFKDAEEVMEAIKIHGDFVKWKEDGCWKLRIIAIHDEHIQFSTNNIIDLDVALREWIFADGTPFGKLEE